MKQLQTGGFIFKQWVNHCEYSLNGRWTYHRTTWKDWLAQVREFDLQKNIIQLHRDIPIGESVIYTDGSKQILGSGSAAILVKSLGNSTGVTEKARTLTCGSIGIFEAEALACIMSASWTSSSSVLVSDNKGVVDTYINKSKCAGSHLGIYKYWISQTVQGNVEWIKGHSGIQGNEAADIIAKESVGLTTLMDLPAPNNLQWKDILVPTQMDTLRKANELLRTHMVKCNMWDLFKWSQGWMSTSKSGPYYAKGEAQCQCGYKHRPSLLHKVVHCGLYSSWRNKWFSTWGAFGNALLSHFRTSTDEEKLDLIKGLLTQELLDLLGKVYTERLVLADSWLKELLKHEHVSTPGVESHQKRSREIAERQIKEERKRKKLELNKKRKLVEIQKAIEKSKRYRYSARFGRGLKRRFEPDVEEEGKMGTRKRVSQANREDLSLGNLGTRTQGNGIRGVREKVKREPSIPRLRQRVKSWRGYVSVRRVP